MYGSTQDKLDRNNRVASHATKLHPARGDISEQRSFVPQPSYREMSLAELRDLRARTVMQRSQLEAQPKSVEKGRQIREIAARLSLINAELKRLNQEVDKDRFATILCAVIREMLDATASERVIGEALRRFHETERS